MDTTDITVVLDHKIRTSIGLLPEGACDLLIEALSIPNVEKERAKKQDIWGWQSMPNEIELFEIEDDTLIMPRGFASDFAEGIRNFGCNIKWIDYRRWEPIYKIGKEPTPLPWQVPAMKDIGACHQGILKAPAGSGKTATVLFTIQQLGVKSIVIVNTKDILWQWQERVTQFLGKDYPCGQIGDGIFEVSPYITIATAQTLHSRFSALEEEGFFDEFSFMCLDEMHHAVATTFRRVVDRFSARYRIGVSATPDKTGDFALATSVLGPIIHTTPVSAVTNLIRPKVVRVSTTFTFPFVGQRSRWQKSNYPQMIDALVKNPERNALICERIIENTGHHQLVVSKRLVHLDLIEQMLIDAGFSDPIVKIRGVDDNEHRQEAKALAEVSPCVLLSTLADEAMDIPRLDRLHLTFPQRNAGLVTQQVGRAERAHPEKKDAIIYDYADMRVGPLSAQWNIRRTEVYLPRKYKIELTPTQAAA